MAKTGGSKGGAMSVLAVVREVRTGAGERRPIAIGGARELVPILARGLRAGGDASAVREGGPFDAAAALVWLGKPDVDALRRASLARVPIVGVSEGESLPYVLDTDLVVVRPGEAMPLAGVARAIAVRLADRGTSLAARLPALRGAVVDELIRTSARRNALLAAGIPAPGAEMPVLTLNQLRLVLRIALAYGREIDPSRAPELAAVFGAGYAFRAVARELLALVPAGGRAAKGAVAYAGTCAVGESARRYFEHGGSVRPRT